MVIQAGEAILRDYDTKGIQELRRQNLIWSAWGDYQVLQSGDHHKLEDSSYGVRRLIDVNAKNLRLFFLSLLWRAAATSLREFAEVGMPAADREALRMMVLNGSHEPISFYPIQLIQISTKGATHNYAGLSARKTIPAVGDRPARTESFFRFYFDGLIAHVQQRAKDDGQTDGLGSLVLANSGELIVPTVTYAASRQHMILSHIMQETYARWPEARNL